MKQWSIAVVAAAFGLACICAQAADPVPVEAFADTDQVTSPRISPDGKHVAVSANLGEGNHAIVVRSEEHTSELQSLMRISYAVFCLQKKKKTDIQKHIPLIITTTQAVLDY